MPGNTILSIVKKKMPGVCLVEKSFSILASSPLQKPQMESLLLWGMKSPMPLADHGAQRMSANTLKTGLDFIAAKSIEKQPEEKRKKILAAYGYGSQLGVILPFSRKHEIEADKIGLELMTIAGFNPKEAAEVWRRMQADAGGKAPPEILTTHPSSQRRIKTLEAHIAYADSLAKVIQK